MESSSAEAHNENLEVSKTKSPSPNFLDTKGISGRVSNLQIQSPRQNLKKEVTMEPISDNKSPFDNLESDDAIIMQNENKLFLMSQTSLKFEKSGGINTPSISDKQKSRQKSQPTEVNHESLPPSRMIPRYVRKVRQQKTEDK